MSETASQNRRDKAWKWYPSQVLLLNVETTSPIAPQEVYVHECWQCRRALGRSKANPIAVALVLLRQPFRPIIGEGNYARSKQPGSNRYRSGVRR